MVPERIRPHAASQSESLKHFDFGTLTSVSMRGCNYDIFEILRVKPVHFHPSHIGCFAPNCSMGDFHLDTGKISCPANDRSCL